VGKRRAIASAPTPMEAGEGKAQQLQAFPNTSIPGGQKGLRHSAEFWQGFSPRMHGTEAPQNSYTHRAAEAMQSPPMLVFDICAGTLGFLSGAIAVSLRKGSRNHGLAGTVFVISMLSLAISGIFLTFIKHKPGDVLGGTLTFYLVGTAWITAKRKERQTGALDWAALFVVLSLLSVIVIFAFEAAYSATGVKYGYSVGPYAFLASVAMIAAAGDLRMLVCGGVAGTQRTARHLWRMCFAFFIAAASIFLARQHLFPAFMRKTGLLFLLSFMPLLLMIFCLIRVRFTNVFKQKPIPARSAYAD